jgi:hypothetical protein
MWQKRSNGVFYGDPERAAFSPTRAYFFTVFDQQLIQVWVSVEDGHLIDRSRKCDLIRIGTEENITAEEPIHFGTTPAAAMKEIDALGQQMTICQLSAHPNHSCNPELDLMPIRKSLYPDILEVNPKFISLAPAQGNSFIESSAVALGPPKGFAKKPGGIQDVVEQSHFAKIKVACEMKSQKIVL